MKKVIRLTESQLTSIVKRVISENMKSEMIDNVKNEIIQSVSKEDLMFLGKMYNELGPEGFKDITQDVIDNEDSQGELSEISFRVKDSSDIDRINKLKELIGQISIAALPLTAAAGIGQMNREVPDESGVLMFGIIGAALVGLSLLRKVPIKGKPVPDKMMGSKIQTTIESQLDDMDLSNKSFEDVIEYFERMGVPNRISIPLISDWAEKNGVDFKNIKKKRKIRFGNG
jgi:hypothetical protein